MPRYFKPAPTPKGQTYPVTRRARNGRLVRDQLPCEGVYTPHEMAQIQEPIPGEWVDLKPGQTGYVFGLRQIIKGA